MLTVDHPSKFQRRRSVLAALLTTAVTAVVCTLAPGSPASAVPTPTPTMDSTTGSVVAVTKVPPTSYGSDPGGGGAWISADGRYTTFQKYADVVPGGRDDAQIFQYDKQTGATVEVYGGDSNGYIIQVTADGRFVLLMGDASNAIPGTTDGHRDVYQWDRSTGALTRVSQETGGHDSGSYSYPESMTDDGRYVVFNSSSRNLVDGVGQAHDGGLLTINLFQWDRTTGAITAVTDGNGASQSSRVFHGGTRVPALISADGRYVTFHSYATDLVAPATAAGQVFQWDRVTGQTTAVTRGPGVSEAAVDASTDGRYVTIASKAPGAGPAGNLDLYQWDRTTGTTTPITDGNADTWVDTVHASDDGARVTFASNATDLVSGTTPAGNTYQWERTTGAITALSSNATNLTAGNWGTSDDGAYVLLGTEATSLTGGTDAGARSLYLWSRSTGTTTAVTTGRASFSPKARAVLSPDGRYVTYVDIDPVAGAGLVSSGNGGGRTTVFQWDRTTGETIAAANPDLDVTLNDSWQRNSAVSADGATIAFWSAASNLAADMPPTTENLYVWDRTDTPATPAQPRWVTSEAGSHQVAVSWQAPLPNGSAAPTSYTVTPYVGDTALPGATVAAPATTATVTGLSDGTTYRLIVRASNAEGAGTPSAAEFATPASVPGTPTLTRVQVGGRTATVTWTPPADNGGASISAYGVTATQEGAAPSATAWFSPSSGHGTIEGLDNGTTYRFQIVARNRAGDSAPSAKSSPITVRPAGAIFVPMTPCRILDTRTGGGAPLPLGSTRLVPTSGACDLPAGAVAIEASITAVTPTGSGFLRAFPTGYSAPNATFLNYVKGQSATNTGAVAITPEAPTGMGIRVYGSPAHVVVDVQGYFIDPATTPPGAVFVPVTPCRALDTRTGGGPLPVSAPRGVDIRGIASCPVPAGAVAVEASVTAVSPSGSGFLRAYPAGSPTPDATFLNYAKGQSTTNTGAIALAAAGPGPDLSLRTYGHATHAVIDITGYFVPPSNAPVGTTFVPRRPCRIVDTRGAGSGGPITPGSARVVATSRPGCNVPADAVAIEASITAVSPVAGGFLRAFAPGVKPPTATFLNYAKGQSTTNTGALPVNAGGLVLAAYAGRTDVVVDVQGYYVAGT